MELQSTFPQSCGIFLVTGRWALQMNLACISFYSYDRAEDQLLGKTGEKALCLTLNSSLDQSLGQDLTYIQFSGPASSLMASIDSMRGINISRCWIAGENEQEVLG